METIKEKRTVGKRRITYRPDTMEAFENGKQSKPVIITLNFYYGEIIKKTGMKQLEAFIVTFLMNCFLTTHSKELGGGLIPEIDVYIDEQRKRIADLAFFSQQQIVSMANGVKEVSLFAIELLSKNESFRETEVKLKDYFDAGVQLVWYISPVSKKIYAYTPQNKVQVFVAGDMAIAEPVLPEFCVEIDKLFTPA